MSRLTLVGGDFVPPAPIEAIDFRTISPLRKSLIQSVVRFKNSGHNEREAVGNYYWRFMHEAQFAFRLAQQIGGVLIDVVRQNQIFGGFHYEVFEAYQESERSKESTLGPTVFLALTHDVVGMRPDADVVAISLIAATNEAIVANELPYQLPLGPKSN